MKHILHPLASDWQQELQQSITNIEDLITFLELDRKNFAKEIECHQHFPLKVPRSYLSRIPKSNPHHPLLRQILPLAIESAITPGFTSDPVGDLNATLTPGLLQKYQGRVLLITTGACAIHCRYCFRRDFPYQEQNLLTHLNQAIEHIAHDTSISEVILSGGDPLILNNRRLFEIGETLENLRHIRRIRLHTRLPICIPSRLDAELIEWLNSRNKPYTIVFHINHPDEIDSAVMTALETLTRPQLLNQAVLLKGINNDTDTLVRLSERCFEARILPYYLHLLDTVQGTAHFKVSQQRGRELISEMRNRLAGYLVPRLAQEILGEAAKQVLL